MPRPYRQQQQRALYISRQSVSDLLSGNPTRSKCLARAAALERQASLCDVLFRWPALAASFRADAEAIRKKAGKPADHETTTEEATC